MGPTEIAAHNLKGCITSLLYLLPKIAKQNQQLEGSLKNSSSAIIESTYNLYRISFLSKGPDQN